MGMIGIQIKVGHPGFPNNFLIFTIFDIDIYSPDWTLCG